MATTSERYALNYHLSAGNRYDAPDGRELISSIFSEDGHYLLMDRAYEDKETRTTAITQSFIPVVPLKGIVKSLRIMTRNFTNAVTKLNVF